MNDVRDADEILLSRFAAGDRTALGELAQRYERPLLGLARGLLGGDSEAACDAVQSMWVRVIKYARSFAGNSTVKTWLYRILINECRDRRGSGRRTSRPGVLRLVGEPIAELEGESSNDALHAALAGLGDEKREVLLVCYHAGGASGGGMSHAVAAEVLGIPVGTLKSRLHAALKELRGTLGEEVVA